MRSITTAHAILRHLKRVQKVDVHAIKTEMMGKGLKDTTDGAVLAYIRNHTDIDLRQSTAAVSDRTMTLAVECGARAVLRDGFRFHIQSNVVATVIPVDRVHMFYKVRRSERRPGAWKARVLRDIA